MRIGDDWNSIFVGMMSYLLPIYVSLSNVSINLHVCFKYSPIFTSYHIFACIFPLIFCLEKQVSLKYKINI
jgi:hypothetical protein